MCADGKQSIRAPVPRKPDEVYAEAQRRKKQRETREMQFIEETMR